MLYKHNRNSVLSNKLTLLILSILLFNSLSLSQTKYDKTFYGGLFYLSEYIASEEFTLLSKVKDDFSLTDSIYFKALDFFDDDISEALLCLTFTSLPYNKIKTKLLFGSQLIIPLPSPSKKVFDKKVENLPKNLFFDSDKNHFGDKDKLAHFFGNAFLRYNFGWFNLSKFMGIFVEYVEEGLFVEGGFSNKDLIANYLGELFAETIKQNKTIRPSEILKIYQLLFLKVIL